MTAILAGEAISGTKIRALIPSLFAANATAAPWLPPEAAATPAAGTGVDRSVLKAPRALNDPRVLQKFELEDHLSVVTEATGKRERRRAANVRRNSRVRSADAVAGGRRNHPHLIARCLLGCKPRTAPARTPEAAKVAHGSGDSPVLA